MANPTTVEQIVTEVEETGCEIVITRDGQPVARLLPPDRWRAMLDRLGHEEN